MKVTGPSYAQKGAKTRTIYCHSVALFPFCRYDIFRKGDTAMYNIDKKEFGAFVAARRKEKGYTQKELAEKLYVSDKAVSKWETGVSQS